MRSGCTAASEVAAAPTLTPQPAKGDGQQDNEPEAHYDEHVESSHPKTLRPPWD